MKYNIVINPRFEFLRDFVENIPHATVAERGQIVYSGRNTVYATVAHDLPVSIKAFHTPRLFNKLVYGIFMHTKARRSFDNAVRLEKLGIGTPAPIAYIEERRFGIIARTYYVCRHLSGYDDLRYWERKENSTMLLKHFGQFIALLHSKGVCHKDFSPGNILYDKDYNFALIDINRMSFNVSSPDILMRSFRALHSESETLRLAHLYAPYSPFRTMSDVEIVELALEKKRQYLREQEWKRRFRPITNFFKRLFKMGKK